MHNQIIPGEFSWLPYYQWLGGHCPITVEVLDNMAHSSGADPKPLSNNVLSITGGLGKDEFFCSIWYMVLAPHWWEWADAADEILEEVRQNNRRGQVG